MGPRPDPDHAVPCKPDPAWDIKQQRVISSNSSSTLSEVEHMVAVSVPTPAQGMGQVPAVGGSRAVAVVTSTAAGEQLEQHYSSVVLLLPITTFIQILWQARPPSHVPTSSFQWPTSSPVGQKEHTHGPNRWLTPAIRGTDTGFSYLTPKSNQCSWKLRGSWGPGSTGKFDTTDIW